jgi:hypothetical protein
MAPRLNFGAIYGVGIRLTRKLFWIFLSIADVNDAFVANHLETLVVAFIGM